MFTKDGIKELHGWTHESLDILLQHISSVPVEPLHTTLTGFGIPTIWRQLVHILTVEEGWICDLQEKPFAGWHEEDCPTLTALLEAKERVRTATLAYVEGLSEEQLNRVLEKRPEGWWGELRSPAFILLHVVTHTFHHKGQSSRCCGRLVIPRQIRTCRGAEGELRRVLQVLVRRFRGKPNKRATKLGQ